MPGSKHTSKTNGTLARKSRRTKRRTNVTNRNTGAARTVAPNDMVKQLSVFPNSKRTTLHYFEDIDLGIPGTAIASYAFAANGLYDPNITGTGHQPMGFDQLMVFYNHYCVLRAKVEVTIRVYSSEAKCGVAVGLAVQRTSSAVSTFSQLVEAGNMTYMHVASIPNGGGPPPAHILHSVDVATFQGLPYPADDDTLRGTASANPAQIIYFVIYQTTPDSNTATLSTFASVHIEYDALFVEPKQPSQSLVPGGPPVVTDHDDFVSVKVKRSEIESKATVRT